MAVANPDSYGLSAWSKLHQTVWGVWRPGNGTGSTPAVVPGAAPALAKAGVGGFLHVLHVAILGYSVIHHFWRNLHIFVGIRNIVPHYGEPRFEMVVAVLRARGTPMLKERGYTTNPWFSLAWMDTKWLTFQHGHSRSEGVRIVGSASTDIDLFLSHQPCTLAVDWSWREPSRATRGPIWGASVGQGLGKRPGSRGYSQQQTR